MVHQRTTDHGQKTSRSRTGFSFAEVMFAVVILGIGFILVAAIFPVAIQQSQATGEEAVGSQLGTESLTSISALSTSLINPNVPLAGQPLADQSQTIQTFSLFPPTVKGNVIGNRNIPPNATTSGEISVPPPAIMVPFVGAQYQAIRGNTILPSDPRFAWTAFYLRESNSPVARVVTIGITTRQRPVFNPLTDLVAPTTVGAAITQRLYTSATGTNRYTMVCPDQITFTSGSVAEGYTAAPTVAAASAQISGAPAGRYYHVGRKLSATKFTLEAGGDMSLTPGAGGAWGAPGGVSDQSLNGPVNIAAPTPLQATVAYAQITAVPNRTGGRIQLVNSPSDHTAPAAAETGAFVVVSDDYPYDPNNPTAAQYSLPSNILSPQPPPLAPPTKPNSYTMGLVNGRVFRLGAAIQQDYEIGQLYPPGSFDLDPEYGMRPPPTAQGAFRESPDTVPCQYLINSSGVYSTFYAKVYIIGMGKDDQGLYGKAAQDVSVYSTIIPVQ